jgi:hypothetical protein
MELNIKEALILYLEPDENEITIYKEKGETSKIEV